MINETARIGIEEILSSLDDNNLFSLAATVSQGLLRNKIQTRAEAIGSIIKYSTDTVSLLKRKLLTKEVLFAYTHNKKVSVQLPATKRDLIDALVKLWHVELAETSRNTNVDSDDDTSNDENISQVSILAEQFGQWFFGMMNSTDIISSEHFYTDCRFRYQIKNCGELIENGIIENNPTEIVQKLYQIKISFNLYFNPNLTNNGVQGRMNQHGLVMVLTCGTLHVNHNCVGIFEEIFGLARDPFAENNWKIKTIELNLKSQSGIIGPPSLCDTEIASNLLSLPICLE